MMNEQRWTPSQREAIEFRGKNLILSAAAGSGKTDTLTERIIRLIGEGADLSRILAVTYTNAAAGELRERIGAALEKMIGENPSDAHAARCLAALDSAKISTIHSFFKSEISPYASKFGLPPDFKIIEEAESIILKKEAMEETVNYFFDSPTDDYEYLCECISGAKSEASLNETLLDIRNTVISYRTDLSSISAQTETDFMLSPVSLPVKKEMREAGEYFSEMFGLFASGLSEAEGERKASLEAQRLQELSQRLSAASDKDFDAAKAYFETASNSFKTLTATKEERNCDCYEHFKSLRDRLKKFLSSMYSDYFSVDKEEYKEICEKYARVTKTLARVLERFERNYSDRKRERGAVDYNDLETMADSIFCHPDGSPTPEALDAGTKYDFILIDEYQDTSLIQDRVFAALAAGCGRFMVGDVKQSIYGFRGARPELFNSYRESYTKGDGGHAVFLSENFRSDKNIIDFTNMVSEQIFKSGAAPFEKEDRLICKKDGGDKNPSPCEVVILRRDEAAEGEKSVDTEPDYVAERILSILNGEEDVGADNISPSDIAILLRSGKKADAMAKALTERGISVNNAAAEQFFSYGEVLLVICLINSADNPMRDIYLAGALKSHIFGFTLEELVRIRGQDHDPLWYSLRRYAEGGSDGTLREKCRDAADKINCWREKSAELDALEILRLILSDTGMLRYGGDGVRRCADVARSIKTLLKGAATVANGGGNLHELCVYFESLSQKQDKAPFAKVPGSVNILTIHKSKGLGFPVCFLCDTASRFSVRDASKSVLLTAGGQISMKLCDDSGLVKCKTPHYAAAACDITRKAVEEEARVLYVAMTRAKNKLIITIPGIKDPEKLLENAKSEAEYPSHPYSVAGTRTFKDWILDAALRNAPSSAFTVKTVSGEDIGHGEYAPAPSADKEDISFEEFFRECTDGTDYSRSYLENIPAKLTVSALKPDILNEGFEESSYIDRKAVTVLPDSPPLPRFLQESGKRSAADAGTATHIFMQFCDFENLQKAGGEAELQRLIDRQFISKEDAEIVRLPEIEKFRESDIFRRILTAKTVLREKRFNARLPAQSFTTEPSLREKLRRDGIKITVQGVVDCIFIDGDGKCVLLDYKTDRLSREELENRELSE
ncbi:MAG: UvrD-helicase domain-containing protein, partial [Clostridia bacterium]|nr:UvrD-helicase domain-containing protein [Clostridia bacterium]